MKRFAKVVAGHLSPASYDTLYGFGLAFDPVPSSYQDTFIDSDVSAFIADREALYLDWCSVQESIVDRVSRQSAEAYHKRRYSECRDQRAEQEKQVVA
jgi:hypothetical protein